MSEYQKLAGDQPIKIKNHCITLFKIYVATRILFVFLVAPTSYTLWNRKDLLNVSEVVFLRVYRSNRQY